MTESQTRRDDPSRRFESLWVWLVRRGGRVSRGRDSCTITEGGERTKRVGTFIVDEERQRWREKWVGQWVNCTKYCLRGTIVLTIPKTGDGPRREGLYDHCSVEYQCTTDVVRVTCLQLVQVSVF